MNPIDTLYAELKPDIAAIANQLFDLSEAFLRDQGNFLPHAAVLTDDGDIILVGAAAESDLTDSVEILPTLHDGLRHQARELPLKAIGVAENVTVTFEGQHPTKAIKVLFEHKRGLTVAPIKSCFVDTSWVSPSQNWLRRKSMRGVTMPSNLSFEAGGYAAAQLQR